MNLLSELLRRRVFQIVGIYLGVIFGAFEFTDMIVERYGLSDRLVDGVLIGMLSFLPTVIMLAWFHGAPGKDEWRKVEKLGIPLNLVASGALVFFLLPGAPMEAASQVRTATTQSGESFTLEVARSDLLDRVAVFFFEPRDFAVDTPWQTYAAAAMVGKSVDRDTFLDAYTLYLGHANGLIWQLKRAGYDSGLGAPLSLLQDIADQYHQDYFTTATLAPEGEGGFRAQVQLRDTKSLAVLLDQSFSGGDLFQLTEAIADAIRATLKSDLAKASVVQQRIPMRELFSANMDAMELYFRGKNTLLLNNDSAGAIDLWEQAIEFDPNFAPVYADLTDLYSDEGQFSAALGKPQAIEPAFAQAHR